MEMMIPAFGENIFSDLRENRKARVITIRECTEELFYRYTALFLDNGFKEKESRHTRKKMYAAFFFETEGVFINYYRETRELSIVMETDCKYFDYLDVNQRVYTGAQIISMHLENYGMSYIVRTSDGRYIIIDGGQDFQPDADRLMKSLTEGVKGGKPIIAAWIMTHPHADHFHCFFPFIEKYRNDVVIEKFFMNFPEADDLEQYPGLVKAASNALKNENMLRLDKEIREIGAMVYTPHTGQIYRVGDAVLEILACMDDTIHRSDNVNATSLVIKMELGGQVILWTADASFGAARIAERYGEYLKADILQIPHHGFSSGPSEDAIAGYKFIQPEVCLLPASDYNAYTTFCTYRKCTNYLMHCCGVKELITGEETRILTLPYHPDDYAERLLRENYLSGRENAGARTWIFTELNTSKRSDFEFSILNVTNLPAQISIDIFFEDGTGKGKIRYIKTTALATRIQKVCIIDPEEIESETVFYNPWSLEKREIPENVSFAVRFMSSIPVVISHREHVATYRTSVYY